MKYINIMCYISVLLYRNSLLLTAIAFIITVISNSIYKHSIDDFPHNVPEWLKSVSTFLLNKRPIAMLTNFNTQVRSIIEYNFNNTYFI